MRLLSIILFCLGIFCLAAEPLVGQSHAQVPLTGAGLGVPGGVVSYSGPGDVVSGAVFYYGLRGYNAAYSGHVISICDSATGLVCADATWSGGVLSLPTIGGLICNNTTNICNIQTFYDMSGTGACAGPCDATQATNASRATLVISAFNGKPCAQFSGAQFYQSPVGFGAQTSPYTFVAEVERTGAFTSAGAWLHSQNYSGFFDSSINTAAIFAGTSTVDATAADSALHSVINFSGAAGNNIVDGVPGTPGNTGTGTTGSSIFIGATSTGPASPLTGFFCEGGEWPIQYNATQYGNMNTNQAAYW